MKRLRYRHGGKPNAITRRMVEEGEKVGDMKCLYSAYQWPHKPSSVTLVKVRLGTPKTQ